MIGKKKFRLSGARGSDLDSQQAFAYDVGAKADGCSAKPCNRGAGMSEREKKGGFPTDRSDFKDYETWLLSDDPAVVANAIICLIHQANYLLDRQIAGLEGQFIQEGGYTERLAAARIEERARQRRQGQVDLTDRAEKDGPVCPKCGNPMVLRTARKGANAGSQFWGCCAYPKCKGVRQIE